MIWLYNRSVLVSEQRILFFIFIFNKDLAKSYENSKIWNSAKIFYNFLFSATALSHEQEEVARAAKHIYLSPAAAASQSQRQSVYNDRAALHSRSLAPPPAAHGAAHSAVTAAAAAAGIHSRTGSLMARYNNFPPTTSYSAVTLASAISSSPRLAHSQNGTGPPGGPPQQQPNSRYYTNRD